jgi:hypothetical protein
VGKNDARKYKQRSKTLTLEYLATTDDENWVFQLVVSRMIKVVFGIVKYIPIVFMSNV